MHVCLQKCERASWRLTVPGSGRGGIYAPRITAAGRAIPFGSDARANTY